MDGWSDFCDGVFGADSYADTSFAILCPQRRRKGKWRTVLMGRLEVAAKLNNSNWEMKNMSDPLCNKENPV